MNFARFVFTLATYPARLAIHAIAHPTDLHLRIRAADIRPSVAADNWEGRS